jgi:A nuclease family of the HNH/ENDO VII superfamily with conserved AHH
MENQINVGVQRQPYEPFEQADSEAENSGAGASLAGDSAGANTSGNPDIANAQVDGESVNQAPLETAPTNNLLNRYGIGDTVILGRPEYVLNNRAAPVETAFVPNEIAETMPFAISSESMSNYAATQQPAMITPASIPTGFIPTPTLQPEPIQICPAEPDLPSSGLETAPPINAKPMGKATTLVFGPRVAIAEASGWNAVPPAPRGCAEYETARAFGAAHGYSDIKIDKLTALLYYQNPEPQFQFDYLSQPNLLSERLDLTPVNSDGTFDIRMGFLLIAERLRTPGSEDNSAANDNLRDLAGLGSPFLEGRSPVRDIPRAGAGQGAQDYANEMTMAAPGYGYSDDYDDAANTYDSPDSTYDDPGSPPQIDYDPLPSLPPVDSTGPIMLPPPDVRLDRELASIPNIGIADPFQHAAGNTSVGNNFNDGVGTNGFNNASIGDPSQSSVGNNNSNTTVNTNAEGVNTLPFDDDGANEEIALTPEEEARLPRTSVEIGPLREVSKPATPPNPEGQGTFMGLNANGQPLYSSSSLPSQGEYRAAPDAPSLIAGDPVLRADATGATPLRDENGTLYYRVNGGSMDGQIIYVQPTTSSLQNEQPATTLENGGTAGRSGDFSLGLAPLATGSTAASRLAGQLASQVLAAEMEFGPPQLRLAAAATLTGAALWAAGRQNTEYEALSPEELDRLRQPLINVPPPPLPPLPGLLPPPVPDNSILPGTSTQPNNLPPLGGFQIAPPQTIDDLITESSRRLDANMRDAGEVKPPGYEPHHMIPENDSNYADLRGRMAALGFDIDGAQNGVYLPGPNASTDASETYHRNLHNPEYRREIESRFEFVTTREEALAAWEQIRTELENGTFPGTRPRPLAK